MAPSPPTFHLLSDVPAPSQNTQLLPSTSPSRSERPNVWESSRSTSLPSRAAVQYSRAGPEAETEGNRGLHPCRLGVEESGGSAPPHWRSRAQSRPTSQL